MADMKTVVSHRSNMSKSTSDVEQKIGQHAPLEPRLEAIHEEDAVGYKEYREGLDIDITPEEVERMPHPELAPAIH